MATKYKKGDYVTNKSIAGSVFVVYLVDVSGLDGGGGPGYVLMRLHNHGDYIAVTEHVLDYYYCRISEEDIPFKLLDSLVQET